MQASWAIAMKDLRLLSREKAALFWVLVWPLITAVLFGVIFGGGGGGSAKPKVAVADLDRTEASAAFVAELRAIDELEVDVQEPAAASELVRTAKRSAAVVVPSGYGAASERMFYGEPPTVQLLIDPSRKAETAMLEGMLQAVGGKRMTRAFTDAQSANTWIASARTEAAGLPADERARYEVFFDALQPVLATNPAATGTGAGGDDWTPIAVERTEVEAKRRGPRNAFAVTFPQGLLWGIIGCVMTFATALVMERVRGTWTRLAAAPLRGADVLFGKALACGLAIVAVGTLLVVVGRLVFGVEAHSYPLLALALFASAVCFTGIMMLISTFGRTVEAVSGAGWAALMPLMLFGGGMMPLFLMPSWMATLSNASPIKWSIYAIEGALWRGFSLAEMLPSVAVLLAIGLAAFFGGARIMRARGT